MTGILRSRVMAAGLAALSLFILISCILGDRQAGRGSEVENEIGVYGALVDETGKPVADAKVKAIPAWAGSVARSDSDSVVTDAKGRYGFKRLGKGEYNLFGDFENGALVVRIPDVIYSGTVHLDLGTHTLRAPGRIQGRVTEAGAGRGGVLCYIPGSSYLAVSDDSGRFTMGGVPEGIYSVAYSETGYLVEPDTGVRVRSGLASVLAEKKLVADPALAPPKPKGLRAVLDTLTGRILLAWNPVSVSDLDGYVVYRDDPITIEPKTLGIVTDTSFIDSAIPPGAWRTGLTYRLKARDKEANLGLFSSAALVSPGNFGNTQTTLKWIAPEGPILAVEDTIRFIIRFDNPSRTNRRIEWTIPGRKEPIAVHTVSSRSGFDTLAWEPRLGPTEIVVTVTDMASEVWTTSRNVDVIDSAGRSVYSGEDRTVAGGSRVHLRGSVGAGFGTVTAWHWNLYPLIDFHSVVSGPDTSIWAPEGMDSLVCVLTATNTQGLTAVDTVVLRIDVPRKMDWDSAVSRPPFLSRDGAGFTVFRNRLWVIGGGHSPTEESGEASKVLSDVWYSDDGEEWTQATAAAGFAPRSRHSVAVFDDKIWVLGGLSIHPTREWNDVWNSGDGVHWDRVTDSAAFPPRYSFPTLAHAGKLWVISGYSERLGDFVGNWDTLKTPSWNDVWSSADGKTWTRVSAATPFDALPAGAQSDGRMHVSGKDGGLWSTTDGLDWRKQALEPAGRRKWGIGLAPIEGHLWAIATASNPYSMCIWKIPAAGTPEFMTARAPFHGGSTFVAFRGRLVAMMVEPAQGTSNRLWFSK